jgi:hypothetical protein
MRSRYTFRLGRKADNGLEILLNVDEETSSRAVVAGNRLLKPSELGFMGMLARRWDNLRGDRMISENDLIGLQVLASTSEQLHLDLGEPEETTTEVVVLVAPKITGYVEDSPF